MVAIRKKTTGTETYYYIEHSFREGGKVGKKEKYLGKILPENIEELKRQFISKIYKEKYFDIFDEIKINYTAEKEITPLLARKKELESFIIKFTYDTNRIEGGKLSLRDTSLLLEKGITPNSKPLHDIKEAEAHRNAFSELLDCKKDISLSIILYFHKKLFENTKKDIAGKLRQHQVMISGRRFIPPFPAEVYPLLMDFITWYGNNKNKLHPIELAAHVHLKLVTIHPFADGNGRISRMLMNFVLQKYGFPMLNIPYVKRAGYYRSLERSQLKKDDNIFLQWFFKRYLKENKNY